MKTTTCTLLSIATRWLIVSSSHQVRQYEALASWPDALELELTGTVLVCLSNALLLKELRVSCNTAEASVSHLSSVTMSTAERRLHATAASKSRSETSSLHMPYQKYGDGMWQKPPHSGCSLHIKPKHYVCSSREGICDLLPWDALVVSIHNSMLQQLIFSGPALELLLCYKDVVLAVHFSFPLCPVGCAKLSI